VHTRLKIKSFGKRFDIFATNSTITKQTWKSCKSMARKSMARPPRPAMPNPEPVVWLYYFAEAKSK
jgi:hypothetical protein